jgi:HK97 family phage major capsid protein
MTKQELTNKIYELRMKNSEILDTIKEEKREAREAEKTELEFLKSQIDDLTEQRSTLEKDLKNKANESTIIVGESRGNEFNIARAIANIVEGRGMDEATLEINKRGQAMFEKTGLNYKGQIILPVEGRSIVTGLATSGKEIITTDQLGLIAGLRENSVIFKCGAVMYSGLQSNLSLPTYTNSTVAWVGETGATTNGQGATGEITWTPKRIGGYIDLSKQFLIQDSINATQVIKDDLVAALMDKLEYTILQATSGNTNQPAGIFHGVTYTSTGATSAMTYSQIVAMESAVATNKALRGKLSYITTPNLRGLLKVTEKATSQGFVVKDAKIDEYPIFASTNVASGKIVFGDWSQYIVAQFGGIDLLVDPYTQAANGKVRIHVTGYFDAKPKRSTSFAYGNFS